MQEPLGWHKAEAKDGLALQTNRPNKTRTDSETLGGTPNTSAVSLRLTVTYAPPKHVNILVHYPKLSLSLTPRQEVTERQKQRVSGFEIVHECITNKVAI
jgi:hypothetical protein